MLLGLGLRHDLPSDHVDDLLTNDGIVHVEALQASD